MKQALIILALISYSTFSFSQELNNTPNANWPYLFNDFSHATVHFTDGTQSHAEFNYNLLSNELQYNQDGEIMKLINPDEISIVNFNDYNMVYIDDQYLVKVNSGNNITIFKKIKGNFNDLLESKGAYGSSTTTASVKQQSDINIGGVNSMNIRTLHSMKNTGKTFRINTNYYYTTMFNSELMPLKKNKLTAAFSKHSSEIKSFLKKQKTSFKDDYDLLKLANFINSLEN